MDLAVLRTAKAALDEGLIDAEDFQAVKGSFVKAQSIKAGLDAGFITDSDFAEARQEFFRSMGITGTLSGVSTIAATPPTPTPDASQPPANAVAPSSPAPAPVAASTSKAAIVSPLKLPEGPAEVQAKPEIDSSRGGVSPASSLAETPTNIPDHGGAQATAGKQSMSGITCHPDSVNIVGEMRIRKKYRWIVFKIGQTGKQVEVDRCGGPKSTFDEFASFMPESECRYGVYDYEYKNSEGTIYGKLVFISWAPEVASTKAKMQHASTKDFFRGFLDGISVELHATEPSELDDDALRDRVSNTVAKK